MLEVDKAVQTCPHAKEVGRIGGIDFVDDVGVNC